MKKLVLFLSVITLLMVSCGKKDTYTINGTAEGDKYVGKTFYLKTFDSEWRNKVIIDSVKIKDSKFKFSGIANENMLGFIIAEDDSLENKGIWRIPFIIEPANIKVYLDKGSVAAKGTAMNNSIYQFFSSLGQKNEPDSEFLAEFVKENNQNLIGAYFLTWLVNSPFKEEYVNDILASMNPELKKYKGVQNVEKLMQRRKETGVGKTYANIKGKTPEDADVSLSDYVGKDKYVLLRFWSSKGAQFYREELPFLIEHHPQYKEKNIEIVGISLDKDIEVWKNAIDSLNMPWSQISDLKGWDGEFATTYGIGSIPHYILIDQDGKILERKDYLWEMETPVLSGLVK